MGARCRYVVALTLGMACQPPPPSESTPAPAPTTPSPTTTPHCPQPRRSLGRRLGTAVAQICEDATVDPKARDAAIDRLLQGTWTGEYRLADGRTSTFSAVLSATAGSVSGSSTEPNNFGPYGYTELEATLTGDVYASRQLVLLKTYRTASVDHSVLYIGQLDESGRRIDGHWRIGETDGTFWMERESTEP